MDPEKKDPEISAAAQPPPPPPPRPLPPPPLPPLANAELLRRLERAEAVIEDLRRRAAAGEESEAARAAKAASKDELKNLDLRLSDLAASYEGLGRAFAREKELAARLEQAESALAEVRAALPSREALLKTKLDALAPKEEVDALRVNVSGALGAQEEMKKRFTQYAEEFSVVESECRKALGEMRGYAKSAGQKPLEARFDDFLKESVARLGDKLAQVETAMHAGLAELSGRMTSGEVLYQKMFTEAEERLRKSVEPELKSLDGQVKWLRENMIRLSEDYTVVAERKMRALEGKYAAFEVIARRMDAIDAALKMSGKMGL
ncbi:MAG: hypothetical protein HY550_07640 [Elusimicrobia bacterium]|nr:hypothetical protein [Elusimicrobiota bacterium]